MKKLIRLTESDIRRIVKRVIREQFSTFKAIATVEGDMEMTFPVKEITYVDGSVNMIIKDPISKKLLKVFNFSGPIYDNNTNQKVYTDSYFSNINMKNYDQIAEKNNIPLMTT